VHESLGAFLGGRVNLPLLPLRRPYRKNYDLRLILAFSVTTPELAVLLLLCCRSDFLSVVYALVSFCVLLLFAMLTYPLLPPTPSHQQQAL